MADVSDPLVPCRSEPPEARPAFCWRMDTPADRLSPRAVLEELGQDLAETRSGEGARERIRAEEFPVVLLDVLLPGIGSFGTARAVRATGGPGTRPSTF